MDPDPNWANNSEREFSIQNQIKKIFVLFHLLFKILIFKKTG